MQKCLLLSLVILVSFIPTNTQAVPDTKTSHEYLQLFSNVYSWTAESGAVNYKVDLVDVATSNAINLETTNTYICLSGVPIATYHVTVKAEFADGSSYIIIEEVLDF